MNSEDVNSYLDLIIIKSTSSDTYKKLSKQQKLIGATELLLGIATRSGVELFFDVPNKYLWKKALSGLQKIKAKSSTKHLKKTLENLKSGEENQFNLKELQNALVLDEFILIKDGIHHLVIDAYNNELPQKKEK